MKKTYKIKSINSIKDNYDLFHSAIDRSISTITAKSLNGLSKIARYAFAGSNELINIEIPVSITEIQSHAFDGCEYIESVYYCSDEEKWSHISIEETGNNYLLSAPLYYYSETEPTIKGNFWHYIDGIPTIWEFYSKGLRFTSNGDGTCSLTGIGTCSDKDVIVPSKSPEGDRVISITGDAFFLAEVDSVIIPEGVLSIDHLSFNYSNIKYIKFPDSIVYINYYSLYSCGIESVSIGKSTAPMIAVFSICGSLKNIIVDPDNTDYKSIDGNLYSKDGKTLIQYTVGKKETEFIVPDSVTNVTARAFLNCFLTTVTFPSNLTTMGNKVFGVEDVDFYTTIDTIIMLGSTPPTIQSNTLYSSISKIIVPKGCSDAYKSATNWSTYADIIEEAEE